MAKVKTALSGKLQTVAKRIEQMHFFSCTMGLQRILTLAAAAAVAGGGLLQPAAAAELIKFDFNWRFFLIGGGGGGGEPNSTATCNSTSFAPTAGACSGLVASDAKTAELCLAACCDELDGSCTSWQFAADPEVSHSPCWIGQCAAPLHAREGWVGGTKPGSKPTPDPEGPPPPPPPATNGPGSAGFDDSGWEAVNVPHDYLISQPYSPSNAFKNGFFPRADGWYRCAHLLRLPAGLCLLLPAPSTYICLSSAGDICLHLPFRKTGNTFGCRRPGLLRWPGGRGTRSGWSSRESTRWRPCSSTGSS